MYAKKASIFSGLFDFKISCISLLKYKQMFRIIKTEKNKHKFVLSKKKEGVSAVERVIFHIDVNSAFLSWEAVYRLRHLGAKTDLRDQVSAVGGNMALRHGIILAKSVPAKKYRIRTGESITEALQKCPRLLIVPPHYNLYERCSEAFMGILRRYSPCVEQYSIDEAFMDMTGTERLWGPPKAAANRIREEISGSLGFTVNIGISSNKLLAKMASDFEKPDKVHTLFPDEIGKKMWPLPVSDLFFVGKATAAKLASMGIGTIGDLAHTDIQILKGHLGKQGEVIWGFANGIDVSMVEPKPPENKGYGNSTTVPFDVCDLSAARMVLLALAETVAARLRKAEVKAEVIAVGIKDTQLRSFSHQMIMDSPTDLAAELHRYAGVLIEQMWDGRPLRQLGLYTSRIRDGHEARQMTLFDRTDYQKLERAEAMVDRIRERYGMDAVKRAVFTDSGSVIDHMSGGISREKRTVDYSKLEHI